MKALTVDSNYNLKFMVMAERPKHGEFIRLEDLQSQDPDLIQAITSSNLFINEAEPGVVDLKAYDYLFRELVEDPNNLLDSTPGVIQALKDLGAAMKENTDTAGEDSDIPTAYTYLGQFIDHDITLETASDDIALASFSTAFFSPIPVGELRNKLKNIRTGSFDLDSLYDNAPKENGRFKLGIVSPFNNQRPANKIDANDLPRRNDANRTAEIGDPRNDENVIIAQLHLAILKFHNSVMEKQNVDFATAEKVVRQHYQFIVIHDFLKKICELDIVNEILRTGNKVYNPSEDNFFMPVEFSAAAFRFGHTMVRTEYNFNDFFNSDGVPASLDLLFKFSGSGDMNGLPTLPENWIIQWENFLPFQTNTHLNARKIDTLLTRHLHELPNQGPIEIFQFLAKRNLLRGYLLSLPTGQSLARRILGEENVLTSDEILNNATIQERDALLAGGLHLKTPLWYYVLAEASIQNSGAHLGKLGSTIVAETIIGLLRRSKDSILREENFLPSLGVNFNLEQLILFSGLGPGQAEN